MIKEGLPARPRLVAGLALGLVLAGVLAAPAFPPLYLAFRWVCHQQPERCLRWGDAPLAVCARCTGLYAGLLLSCVMPLRAPRWLLGGLVLLQVADVGAGFLPREARLLSAALLVWFAWSEVWKLAGREKAGGH